MSDNCFQTCYQKCQSNNSDGQKLCAIFCANNCLLKIEPNPLPIKDIIVNPLSITNGSTQKETPRGDTSKN